jgi:dTDP-4-amino-4,6-dideoxygalactose transaminase
MAELGHFNMEYKYPVAKPSLKGNELEYVTDAVKREWISSQGNYVKKFEEEFAKWNNRKYGIACSSGTNALILAIRALNLSPGDEVIVPEFTMIASAWAVDYGGGIPVFVDCKDDLNIDEKSIEGKLTSRTKAIMPVHIYGRKCNMDKINDIAYNYNLSVVEDSSEAHGVKPTGDIACFSLYANKIITSGEGGICVTDDERLARQMDHLKAMAFTPQHDFLHPKRAYNFRMTNLQGAVALAQFEKIEEILERRREIERNYNEGLKEVNGVTLMPERDVLWMYDILAQDREGLQKYLEEHGIETRKFFKPMSQQPMYYNPNWEKLNAVRFSRDGLYLPTYFDLTKENQEEIVQRIKDFYNRKD